MDVGKIKWRIEKRKKTPDEIILREKKRMEKERKRIEEEFDRMVEKKYGILSMKTKD